MGKYTRSCRGAEDAAARPSPAKKRRRGEQDSRAATDGRSYMQLRSRQLFLVPAVPSRKGAPAAAPAAAPAVIAAEESLSRCSSIASAAIASEKDAVSSVIIGETGSAPRKESLISGNEGGDPSDTESEFEGTSPASRRRPPTLSAATEIEAFFAAAERAEAERFKAKYNFDVAAGAPLHGGRYEWVPLQS